MFVHNEVTFRSLEIFSPSNDLQQTYKSDFQDSASYTQAGSFFPDWGYQCLGYNQQAEDAHWPTFIKTAVNYIRDTYPYSSFHTDDKVKGLISFIFATMSHGMADVKWHSLGGLEEYFIVAMAKSDFNGNINDAHLAADAGAEFALRHSSPLSYLNETWQVPINDIIEIYKRLYVNSNTRIPLASHIQYCMTTAFAASKIDVQFGQFMFGYYGSKSPFLTEELYDYFKGGIQDLSAGVSDCYPQLIDAFENGISYSHPDVLCAPFFNTNEKKTTIESNKPPKCSTPHSHYNNKNQSHGEKDQNLRSQLYQKYRDIIYEYYDHNSGVLTITANLGKAKNQKTKSDDGLYQQHKQQYSFMTHQSKDDGDADDKLPVFITRKKARRNTSLRYQMSNVLPSSFSTASYDNEIKPVKGQCKFLTKNTGINMMTLTLPVSSAAVGHQTALGDFDADGHMDIAISAPYNHNSGKLTGAVYILNNTSNYKGEQDLRDLSQVIMYGTQDHGRFGWSMTTLDLNADGTDDLAVTTPLSNGSRIDIFFGKPHVGLLPQPNVRIKLEPDAFHGTVLEGIDVNHNGFKDLIVGCPYCYDRNHPQSGSLQIYLSRKGMASRNPAYRHQPDLVFKNPFPNAYDHFGASVAVSKDNVILIGAPGFSLKLSQRVGRVYAFDITTGRILWTMTGTREFQQFGSVIVFDGESTIAISSPSEKTSVGLQKFWQGGSVRVYDWNKMNRPPGNGVLDLNPNDGLLRQIKGRSNAGHLGKSLSISRHENISKLWIGEPMAERENGRVYEWKFSHDSDDDDEISCIRNDFGLARFGSQIELISPYTISVTSQRYGKTGRFSGAVHLISRDQI
ncbi:hypothetical protein K501DRAFT_324454 [Backusella circina FSU 941]|nr:hypothetical protein K501DRAFT_324454 [Backusella circina FSU 941]